MTENRVRLPAVAGTFYLGNASELKEIVATYLQQATPPALTNVHAVISPHAGHIYSGPIAAFGYKLLANQTTPPRRFWLWGPAHRVWFHGVALADYQAFQTPLGESQVDVQTVEKLLELDHLFHQLTQAHVEEHSLEVQLPFLQMIYPEVPIIPMLFGEVDAVMVGEVLSTYIEPGDVVVVSSDLSHYHGYTEAQHLDRSFIDAVLHEDVVGVASGEACGQSPILSLMTLAGPRNWHPHLLDYRNSGDTAGDQRHVVGYASIAYVEG